MADLPVGKNSLQCLWAIIVDLGLHVHSSVQNSERARLEGGINHHGEHMQGK